MKERLKRAMLSEGDVQKGAMLSKGEGLKRAMLSEDEVEIRRCSVKERLEECDPQWSEMLKKGEAQ